MTVDYLVEFYYKENFFESKTSFKTECMRDHLIQCVERGYFTKFSQNYNLNSNFTLKHKMVKIHCCCPCGFPDWVDAMIDCDFKAGRNVVMYGSIQSVQMLRQIVMNGFVMNIVVNKN